MLKMCEVAGLSRILIGRERAGGAALGVVGVLVSTCNERCASIKHEGGPQRCGVEGIEACVSEIVARYGYMVLRGLRAATLALEMDLIASLAGLRECVAIFALLHPCLCPIPTMCHNVAWRATASRYRCSAFYDTLSSATLSRITIQLSLQIIIVHVNEMRRWLTGTVPARISAVLLSRVRCTLTLSPRPPSSTPSSGLGMRNHHSAACRQESSALFSDDESL